MSKKPIIGILGGICSGKSTVASELGKLGCAIIDADKIAKELLDEATIQPKIIELFGKDILGPEGKINRQRLAKIVFGQPQGLPLQALTNIIHPPVFEKTESLIEKYQKDKNFIAIVLDMPLLAEVGWQKRCDKLIFVHCDPKIKSERAKNRGLFNENELKARENFQISLDKKERMSHYVIYNNFDMLELALQVSRIFNTIMRKA